jgi:hypothetical protein
MYAYTLLIHILHASLYAYTASLYAYTASLYAYTHFWFSGIPIDYLGSIGHPFDARFSSKTWGRRFGSALKIVAPLVCTKNSSTFGLY